jgi:hypothetical protein
MSNCILTIYRKPLLLTAFVTAGVCAGGAHASTLENDYGSLAPASAAVKTLTIKPQTKWVNVDNGETVTFVSGGQSFTWSFRTLRETEDFQLSAIAPAGFNAGKVEVYVASDPLYR